jgi:hypothetical protein
MGSICGPRVWRLGWPGKLAQESAFGDGRFAVLVMAALAICAVTAAQLRGRTDTQAPPPVIPGQSTPPQSGMIPLTVPEIARILAARLPRSGPPGRTGHWLNWRRRRRSRSRWYHRRTRLNRENVLATWQLALPY